MSRVEKSLVGLLALILAGVTAAATYAVIGQTTRGCDASIDGWRAPHAHRNEIAHRLVECHSLDGLQKDSLLVELGRPRERSAVEGRPGVEVWRYAAGSEPGF